MLIYEYMGLAVAIAVAYCGGLWLSLKIESFMIDRMYKKGKKP